MTRYRLCVFERAVTPWRETMAEARQDALRLGHGSRDEHTGRVFLTVPAQIKVGEPGHPSSWI